MQLSSAAAAVGVVAPAGAAQSCCGSAWVAMMKATRHDGGGGVGSGSSGAGRRWRRAALTVALLLFAIASLDRSHRTSMISQSLHSHPAEDMRRSVTQGLHTVTELHLPQQDNPAAAEEHISIRVVQPQPTTGSSSASSGAPTLLVPMELRPFTGSIAMRQQRRPSGEKLQFPRKKLRYQLTHYELGKVTKGLWESLPEEDPKGPSGRAHV